MSAIAAPPQPRASAPLVQLHEPALEAEVLVEVSNLSKKFCRDLKKSLWYGCKDVASELMPWARRQREIEGSGSVLRDGEFWAVNDVSFQLRRGECLGLIGHNGAGKTTLLKMLNGLIKPDSGSITMRGRIGALIALGAGFNPILTGRENIYINGAVLGLTRREINAKLDEIIDFAEIGAFIDAPVQSYSSGMTVRLGFAVATALKPDVLLLDEVLAVGDATFRSKCYKRIGEIISDCAVIFVSHDSYSIRRICENVLWLKRGATMFQGRVEEGMERYGIDQIQGDDSRALRPFYNTAAGIEIISTGVRILPAKLAGGAESTAVEVIVRFHSERRFHLGMRLGNVVTQDQQAIAQFDFSSCINEVCEGENVLALRIDDLRLARGSYNLGLVIYDGRNKNLVINLRNLKPFQVSGNVRYGPFYAPSCRTIDA